MAIIADFMLVWLPAPTVSLRPPLAKVPDLLLSFSTAVLIMHFRLFFISVFRYLLGVSGCSFDTQL